MDFYFTPNFEKTKQRSQLGRCKGTGLKGAARRWIHENDEDLPETNITHMDVSKNRWKPQFLDGL